MRIIRYYMHMEEKLYIERLCYGADAIAHDKNGRTVFVSGAAPGETVPVRLTEEKPRFARGIVTGTPDGNSQWRVNPKCSDCGGCPWGHITHEAQLQAKTDNLKDALIRTGHLDAVRVDELVHPCIASPADWGYRNKIELAAGKDKAGHLILGMTEGGSNTIASIDSCPLANKTIAKTPKALRGALRFLSGSADLGLFRVGVRGSVRTHDVEVALWTTPGPFPRAQAAKVLKEAIPGVSSVVRVVADKGKARTVKQVEGIWGKGCWEEELAGSHYLTSAPSFFQVNTPQAEVLVGCAMHFLAGHTQFDSASLKNFAEDKEIAGALEGAFVADLYAGGGTFTLPLAKLGADVVAVESAGSSVRDLRRNAERAGVFVDVVGGDAARELPELGELDALIVDPPRAGLAPGVPASIAEANPERVVYVSCDPATLARDIAVFETLGYELKVAQPVDLFPQTYHCETVVLMSKVNPNK